MPTDKLVINCRIEEVPTLALFTIDALSRDTTDFVSYKPNKYNANAVVNDLTTRRTAVMAVIFPKQLTAELKLITLRILTNMVALRPLLDRLEGYVRDAVGLTVGVDDFGISEVRQQIGEDDQEGLDGALLYLEGNINANIGALQTQGYQNAEFTQLQSLHQQINTDNAAQKSKEDQRAQLVQNNLGIINDLCKVMKGVWADGKSIYKSSNTVKVKDYTFAQLKNRIRQEELKTEITGTVKDAQGNLLKSVKIVARPVFLGKRGKTTKSNKDSIFSLKGLRPIAFNITAYPKNGVPFVKQVEAVTGQTVTVTLEP